MQALRQLLANYSLSRVRGKEGCVDRDEFPNSAKTRKRGAVRSVKLMKVDVSAATGPADDNERGDSKNKCASHDSN